MIQIYTGEGKGKTTAAVGLAIRASSNNRVLFTQLVKDGTSSEIQTLKKAKVTVKTFGEGKRIYPGKENQKEKENTKKALEYISQNAKEFDVVILDEGITACSLGIIPEAELVRFIKEFPAEKELIITGRGVTKSLIKLADLVTEMKNIKHYYENGMKSRKGIEY